MPARVKPEFGLTIKQNILERSKAVISKDLGFELFLIPVAGKEMQNQSSHWLKVRKEKLFKKINIILEFV